MAFSGDWPVMPPEWQAADQAIQHDLTTLSDRLDRIDLRAEEVAVIGYAAGGLGVAEAVEASSLTLTQMKTNRYNVLSILGVTSTIPAAYALYDKGILQVDREPRPELVFDALTALVAKHVLYGDSIARITERLALANISHQEVVEARRFLIKEYLNAKPVVTPRRLTQFGYIVPKKDI